MAAKRILAATQVLLLFPAILFMSSLVVRQFLSLQRPPAYAAQQIVMWYAQRLWTLWALLITLPLAVLITGSVMLLRSWRTLPELPNSVPRRLAAIHAEGAMRLITVMTLMAGVVLAIVVLHMGAN